MLGILTLAGCAAQSDMTALDNRLTEMELRDAEARKSSEAIQSQVESYTKIRESMDEELRRQSASLHALIEELREENRILNGKIEEINYSLKQQKNTAEDFEKKSESTSNRIEERVARMEQYLNFESTAKPAKTAPAITTGSQPKVPKALPEEELYAMGKQALDQGDSDTARKQFQELITRYPKSANADNAQFWLGEIYYREKWYEKAILEYQKVIENYPQGNKVPSALLKQGLAFSNLGDNANSRLVLEELIRKYPSSSEAKIAGDKLKESR